MAGVGPRSARALAFVRERGIGKTRTRTTAISIPQISKRTGQDIFILETPSMQSEGKSQTFYFGKRIPPAILKLRRSSARVNRYPGQAGTVCHFWEQTVTFRCILLGRSRERCFT